MVQATLVVNASHSFYARVGDDYRIVIPKSLRESVLDIKEGDVLWVIIGTVYPKGRQTIMIP